MPAVDAVVRLTPLRSVVSAGLYWFAARGYGTGVKGAAAGMAAAGVHGFPAVLTSFVGREQAAREVTGLLGEYRLVTVTGPGGVGKTRLAGEVARLVAGRFADGAWLAELAPVRDSARVAAVVAVALGIREQPGMGAADAVVRVVARRQLLVVLDNCEHMIAAAAQLCAGLLQASDDVRVLATSREPLRIAGEAVYRLAPLPVPGSGDDVAGADAVALFADRARAADAGFALTDQNSADVARLVVRLDGMPARDRAGRGAGRGARGVPVAGPAGAAGGRGPAGGRPAPVAGGRRAVELPAAGRPGTAGESPRVLWRLPIHGRVGRWEQHGSIRTSCVTGRSGWCWTWSRIRTPA